MRRTFFQACLIFVFLTLPLGFFLWRKAAPQPPLSPPISPAQEIVPVEPRSAPARDSEAPVVEFSLPSLEAGWLKALNEARSSRDRMSGLRAIENELMALEAGEASKRILAFLRSGTDRSTGLPWILGEGGRLQSASSLRVWLLDLLGRINPIAAADWARDALSALSGSPNEYAVNLRNFAWGSTQDAAQIRSFLVERTVAMLDHEPWREAPSRGFQEAFDVLVWAEAGERIGLLLEMAGPDQPERLRHPARLALERLVARAPQASLSALAGNLEALDGAPRLRAGYFAQANLAEEAQRSYVEAYLLNSELNASERSYFWRLLPNVNHSFSHNLLSENEALSHVATVDRFKSAEVVLEAWLADPRFAPMEDELTAARARIREVLESPFATEEPRG